MTSSYCGQTALLPTPKYPPSNSINGKLVSIESYNLPSNLQAGGDQNHSNNKDTSSVNSSSSFSSSSWLEVLKVSKNGKLQSRRIAIAPDHRGLFVTTHRIKSVKSLLRYALNTKETGSTSRAIDLSAIDHIECGQHSKKFLLARIAVVVSKSYGLSVDYNNSNHTDNHALFEGASRSLSIVYRVTEKSSSSGGGSASSSSMSSSASSSSPSTSHMIPPPSPTSSFLVDNVVTSSSSLISGVSSGKGSSHASTFHCNGTSRFETLDLIVSNQQDYRMLVSTLQNLLVLYRFEKMRYDRTVSFLRYHWDSLGKRYHEPLNPSEWLMLCERANVPLLRSDLIPLYRNYEKESRESKESSNTSAASNTMNLQKIGELLEEVQDASGIMTLQTQTNPHQPHNNDPFQTLWNEIVATDPIPSLKLAEGDDDASVELQVQTNRDKEEESISAIAFLSFIRSTQKQYSVSLEDVINLVHVLNNQVTLDDIDAKTGQYDLSHDPKLSPKDSPQNDRLAKSRFFSYLFSETNDILDPSKGRVGSDDMTQPLSHYWINTSHDTYLEKVSELLETPTSFTYTSPSSGNSDYCGPDFVDEQMYFVALYRGARCLELDVWDGISGCEPVVCRQNYSTENSIPLAVVLRIIRAFLEAHPNSFPIILRIENHCSLPVQSKIVEHLQQILGTGDQGLLAQPKLGAEVDFNSSLPSPAQLKGKVLIMAKRPMIITDETKVMHDDYDDENDVSDVKEFQLNQMDYVDGADENSSVVSTMSSMVSVMGYYPDNDDDAYSESKDSPQEKFEMAAREAETAAIEAKEAEARANRLRMEADDAETLAATLTQEAGLLASDVVNRAASPRKQKLAESVEVEWNGDLEDGNGINCPQGEGLEVQEFLKDEVKGSRNRYSVVIAEAIEASEHATICLSKLKEADLALKEAETVLYRSTQKQRSNSDNARRAAVLARSNAEHAESAQRRLETVQQLWKKCADGAKSAETVVVTAATEAKISERRAAEAETRASRALANAERDRGRSDEETRREEELEQEVSRLHNERTEAANVSQLAQERVQKAAAMLTKLNEQIDLIENSVQFQNEVKQNPGYITGDISEQLKGCPIISQHIKKLAEREMCRELIKEASQEHNKAESLRKKAQEAFESKAQVWKVQTDHATKIRKQADRSSFVADEYAEHAEEEREAATLRQIAKEKAEANVQQQNAHLESVKAQLAEAERAATQAKLIAKESRTKAEELAQKTDVVVDNSAKTRTVDKCRFVRDQAFADYEKARIAKEKADAVAADTKRLLETNAELYSSAVRDIAAETNRAQSKKLAEQKAVVAYNRALLTRKQADHAMALAKISTATAQDKTIAARRAKYFKEKNERLFPIPKHLAKITYLHTMKHKYWGKSLTLPTFHVLSVSHRTASLMLTHNAHDCIEKEQKNFEVFTKNHLCRSFPSRDNSNARKTPTRKNTINPSTNHGRSHLNYDPVFFWSMGIQFVSMNYFSPDEHLIVNDGRFRQNGSCGYVLKPPTLLGPAVTNGSWVQQEKEQRWKVNVISASYLPRSESRIMVRKHNNHDASKNQNSPTSDISPFVKITLYEGKIVAQEEQDNIGWSDDGDSKKTQTSSTKSLDKNHKTIQHCFTTHAVKYNGFNPIWNDPEGFTFVSTKPSIAMLEFSVWDHKGVAAGGGGEGGTTTSSPCRSENADFIGAGAAPLSCIREGYRSVALFDANATRSGPYAYASLFIRVQKLSS